MEKIFKTRNCLDILYVAAAYSEIRRTCMKCGGGKYDGVQQEDYLFFYV